MTSNEALKKEVHDFWNTNPCGSDTAVAEQRTKAYYDQIEAFRYANEPVILSFAQFLQYRGKKVLEVGVGLGTDFLQWVRGGAEAHGVDLTEAAIDHVKHRLSVYGLKAAELRVADAEHLPFPDNQFDLVYCWGVIMHTPDTFQALNELIRVAKPGGEVKIMVYNRHSLNTFHVWFKNAFLKGRPWKNFSWALYHFQESKGTKAYTVGEIKRELASHAVTDIQIQTHITYGDTLEHSQKPLVKWYGGLLAKLLPFPALGWFMTVRFKKKT